MDNLINNQLINNLIHFLYIFMSKIQKKFFHNVGNSRKIQNGRRQTTFDLNIRTNIFRLILLNLYFFTFLAYSILILGKK